MATDYKRFVGCIGMHHYGPKELAVGERYRLTWDQNNAYGMNAMAITDEGRICVYLKRDNTFVVAKLVKEKYVTDKYVQIHEIRKMY